jgi:hypothetical protein
MCPAFKEPREPRKPDVSPDICRVGFRYILSRTPRLAGRELKRGSGRGPLRVATLRPNLGREHGFYHQQSRNPPQKLAFPLLFILWRLVSVPVPTVFEVPSGIYHAVCRDTFGIKAFSITCSCSLLVRQIDSAEEERSVACAPSRLSRKKITPVYHAIHLTDCFGFTALHVGSKERH